MSDDDHIDLPPPGAPKRVARWAVVAVVLLASSGCSPPDGSDGFEDESRGEVRLVAWEEVDRGADGRLVVGWETGSGCGEVAEAVARRSPSGWEIGVIAEKPGNSCNDDLVIEGVELQIAELSFGDSVIPLAEHDVPEADAVPWRSMTISSEEWAATLDE